jgi:hypothetical protein
LFNKPSFEYSFYQHFSRNIRLRDTGYIKIRDEYRERKEKKKTERERERNQVRERKGTYSDIQKRIF